MKKPLSTSAAVLFCAAATTTALAQTPQTPTPQTPPIPVMPAQRPGNSTALTTPATQIIPPAYAALRGSLKADKKVLRDGEAITFTYSVTNTSKTAQAINFSSGQRFDLIVAAKGSPAPVWQMSGHFMYVMMMSRLLFAPGETKTFTGLWTPVAGVTKPGKSFTVSAFLTPRPSNVATDSRPAPASLMLPAAPH